MANYTVFESVNMKSTHYAERIFDAVATEDIENGTFGYLDGLDDGEDVIYKFVKGSATGNQVVVVDQPVWNSDECKITNQRKDNFIIKAGTPFRVRVVAFNDEFAISIDGITSATQSKADTGKFLTIDTTTGKLVAGDSATSDAKFEATIMRKRVQGATLVTVANTYGYSRVMYEAKVTTLA